MKTELKKKLWTWNWKQKAQEEDQDQDEKSRLENMTHSSRKEFEIAELQIAVLHTVFRICHFWTMYFAVFKLTAKHVVHGILQCSHATSFPKFSSCCDETVGPFSLLYTMNTEEISWMVVVMNVASHCLSTVLFPFLPLCFI